MVALNTNNGFATFSAGNNLTVLTGDAGMKAAGDFVRQGQTMGKDDGFGAVSKKWLVKTMTFEQGLEQLAQGKAKTEDVTAPLNLMTPAVSDEGKFVVRHRDGREFKPTQHCLEQMGTWAGCGAWFVKQLATHPTDKKGDNLFLRDSQDARTLAMVFNNGFRRMDGGKDFLWRTREDGTLRAMLSTQYAKIDNEWFVRSLQTLLPGGRLSHWRGDSDTVFGNVLIPDSLRAEADSDYGGMLSVGNSEIGERKISSMPSIFRSICMNGCIWGQKEGQAIKQIHRGKIDLAQLYLAIKENLEKQIPLLPAGIEKLLGTRRLAWDGASAKPMFAMVAKDFDLTKKQASSLLTAYRTEADTTPEYAKTLFGLVNAVTRAGQTHENDTWVAFDLLGGRLTDFEADRWESFVKRAKAMKAKEVEEMFSTAA